MLGSGASQASAWSKSRPATMLMVTDGHSASALSTVAIRRSCVRIAEARQLLIT
jgi:hypothetical protein